MLVRKILAGALVVAACSGNAMEVPQPADPEQDARTAVSESAVFLSRVEQGELLAQCLADEGFSGQVDPVSGGVNIELGDPAQEPVMHEAFLGCMDRLQEIVGPPPDETPEYWTMVYRAWLWTHECLVEHGYQATDPPSLDLFLDGGDDRWYPYEFRDNDPAISVEEFYQIEDTCPDNPQFLFTYLDMDG